MVREVGGFWSRLVEGNDSPPATLLRAWQEGSPPLPTPQSAASPATASSSEDPQVTSARITARTGLAAATISLIVSSSIALVGSVYVGEREDARQDDLRAAEQVEENESLNCGAVELRMASQVTDPGHKIAVELLIEMDSLGDLVSTEELDACPNLEKFIDEVEQTMGQSPAP
jgi:hypothetical protein